jgi:hypothetical protein
MIQNTKNPIENTQAVCPICRESKDSIHIHKIYADLLSGAFVQDAHGYSKNQLTRLVSPPALTNNTKRTSIHPDLLALILLIIFVYLFTIQLAEKGAYILGYGLGIGVVLIAYGFLRQRLLTKFDRNKHDREILISDVRAKADVWMELVYCKKDDLVFTPDQKVKLKLDQLSDFWLKKVGDQG